MKNVLATLKKENLQVTDLPQELQERANSLQNLYDKFKTAAKEYDEQEEIDKETEKMLDQMEDNVAFEDENLSDDIEDFVKQKNTPTAPEPKKEGGFGFIAFGVFALLVTMGAVNHFKKR